MRWMQTTTPGDRRAALIADRHYSRKTPGSPQFAPPGRRLVLVTPAYDALWVTAWPYPELVMHSFGDCWNCVLFRNESAHLSSLLIQEAVAATVWRYGVAPAGGMITFINARKVRHKRDPGRCYRKAGFVDIGKTKSGLIVLRLAAERMPAAQAPLTRQLNLGVA